MRGEGSTSRWGVGVVHVLWLLVRAGETHLVGRWQWWRVGGQDHLRSQGGGLSEQGDIGGSGGVDWHAGHARGVCEFSLVWWWR